MSPRYPFINFRRPSCADRENLLKLRSMNGEGKRSSKSQGAQPVHSKERDPAGESEEDHLERKKILNERDRKRRLQAMQDKLEVVNELRESGYILIKND